MAEKEKLLVLVVEDQQINRQILRNILSLEYNVAEAENGAVALKVLEEKPDVAAILLDIMMPVMDGYTFLERLRGTPHAALPVIAITGEKDENAEQKALDLGAWDFVSKPYRPMTLLTRLKNVIVRSQLYLINQMKYVYEHDPVTDLYNRTSFFEETRRLLERETEIKFALVRFDIDHFQTYNSFWGEEEGDRLLRYLADRLRAVSRKCQPCVYARINADAFCICLPFDAEAIERFVKRAVAELDQYNREYRLVPSFGIYVIEDRHEKIQKMYELATTAAQGCKGSSVKYLSYYRPEMSEKLLQDQWVINEMEKALAQQQFEVYLQPKYNLMTEQPYGAEALIRWRHPERGMLSPGLFIPVFEQNGFIGKIDYYMWDKTSALLRRWMDEGREPGPISVNVSRVNLYNQNLVEILCSLVKKHNIPARLLQLELTESAYMDNPAVMNDTVHRLQQAGFCILMDDFGSGYAEGYSGRRAENRHEVPRRRFGQRAEPLHPHLDGAYGGLAFDARDHGGRGNGAAGGVPAQHRLQLRAGVLLCPAHAGDGIRKTAGCRAAGACAAAHGASAGNCGRPLVEPRGQRDAVPGYGHARRHL